MRGAAFVVLIAALPVAARAQATPPANMLDETASPGKNYENADFRLWLPQGGAVQGIVVLVPGSNGDGRGEASDTAWERFGPAHKLALVGCRFTDKPPRGFMEDYVNVGQGSGQALLDALNSFAARAKH